MEPLTETWPSAQRTAADRSGLEATWAFGRRNQGALGSLVFLLVLVVIAVFAGQLAPFDPKDIHRDELRELIRFESPSSRFLLGTDELGRDLLSRLMFGARVSLGVGFISVALAALVGVPLGLWGGYILGIYDSILMGVVDAVLAFPAILLAMVMVGILGPSPKNVTIALAVVFLPRFVRIARASMLTQRALPYVESAQAIGAPQYYIVTRTILPNAFGPILVQMAVAMAEAILLEAGLSFLGLGIQPPNPSWGLMIGRAKSFLDQAPWYGVGPGIMLVLVVLALNGLADGIQKFLDPQRRKA